MLDLKCSTTVVFEEIYKLQSFFFRIDSFALGYFIVASKKANNINENFVDEALFAWKKQIKMRGKAHIPSEEKKTTTSWANKCFIHVCIYRINPGKQTLHSQCSNVFSSLFFAHPLRKRGDKN